MKIPEKLEIAKPGVVYREPKRNRFWPSTAQESVLADKLNEVIAFLEERERFN